MKLKFKNQQFQTDAARAVTDVFRGQRNQAMVEFTHDMGRSADGAQDLFDVVGSCWRIYERYRCRHSCVHRKR